MGRGEMRNSTFPSLEKDCRRHWSVCLAVWHALGQEGTRKPGTSVRVLEGGLGGGQGLRELRAGLEQRAGAGERDHRPPSALGLAPAVPLLCREPVTWTWLSHLPTPELGQAAPPLTAPMAAQREAVLAAETGASCVPFLRQPGARATCVNQSFLLRTVLRYSFENPSRRRKVAAARTGSCLSTSASYEESWGSCASMASLYYFLLHTRLLTALNQAIGCWAPPHFVYWAKRVPPSHLEGHALAAGPWGRGSSARPLP